ncbi:MAG TPA: hypothetical protein VJA21_32525 [Verrucomicrobiae bacterium]
MARASFHHYRQLLRGANQFSQMLQCDCINGYAIGLKRVRGKMTSDLALTVFVSRKLSLRRLPLASRIPQTLRLPDERVADGVLEFVTDVQEAQFQSLEYVARQRPAPSGISIGHVAITAGTLGGLVRDKASGAVVILSNNHVLANSNEGVPGDAILQPGPHDGGVDPGDRIATLTRFVPINFQPHAGNRVDGAIATPTDPARNQVIWNTRDIGPKTPALARDLGDADLGLAVQKTGRTTSHTEGFVQSLFATVQVKYDLFRQATFVDQIIVSQAASQPEFSNGGDSGSLVYDADRRCIGLLFGGSEGTANEPGITIVNPIPHVLRELNVEFLAPDSFPSAAAIRRRRPSVRK